MENLRDKEITYCKEINISFTNLCYNVKNIFDKGTYIKYTTNDYFFVFNEFTTSVITK